MYERDKYIAAAIVEKIPLNGNYSGIDYVNKLAVSKEQQGKGIGHILLNVVDERSPKFILRASPDNHDAHLFYKKRGNGKGGKPLHLTEGKRWDVYYTDMAPEEFKFARTYAVSKPETLIPLLNKEIIVNVSRKKSLSNRI
jgi:acetylglutamate synthase